MYYGYFSHDEACKLNPSEGILAYCNRHKLKLAQMVNDEVSNKVHWDKRALFNLIVDTAKAGDTIITFE